MIHNERLRERLRSYQPATCGRERLGDPLHVSRKSMSEYGTPITYATVFSSWTITILLLRAVLRA